MAEPFALQRRYFATAQYDGKPLVILRAAPEESIPIPLKVLFS